MMEEDRRAAVLAAADAARLADRDGGGVWRAATQLDFALLALWTTAPYTCFQGELLPEMYSISLAHLIHRVSYHWLLGGTYTLSTVGPMSRVRGAIERLARRGVLPGTEHDRERVHWLRERALREREVEAALLVMERITAFSVAAAAC